MDRAGALLIGLALFMLTMIAVGVPSAVAILTAGLAGHSVIASWSPLINHLKTFAYARFSSDDLSIIPLLLLMGQFTTQGGLSRALFKFPAALLSSFRGGLTMAAVVACAAVGGLGWPSVAIITGILVLMAIEIGLFASPKGLNVDVVNGMDKRTPVDASYRGVVPFLISDLLRTALLLAFPAISLVLVRMTK